MCVGCVHARVCVYMCVRVTCVVYCKVCAGTYILAFARLLADLRTNNT